MASELELNQEKAGQAFEEGMNLIQDVAGWTEISANTDITTYKRSTESGINALKTESFFNKPFAQMAEYVWTNSIDLEKTLWDMVGHMEYVKEYEDGSKIRVGRTRTIGPVSPREGYVYLSKIQLDESTIVILGTSTPLEFPVAEDHIRCDFKFSMLIFEAVAGNASKTHLTTLDQMDPQGNLPHLLINETSVARFKFCEALVNKLKSL